MCEDLNGANHLGSLGLRHVIRDETSQLMTSRAAADSGRYAAVEPEMTELPMAIMDP